MNYFIVFQNASYDEERSGGFLWAPTKNNDDRTFHYWTTMTNVKKDDLVFNSVGGYLLDIITVLEDCNEQEKPVGLDKKELWRNHGWYVKGEYNRVENPIKFSDYSEEIRNLQAPKYAPFNIKGGGNQGYLYQISQEFANFLLELLGYIRPDEEAFIIDIETRLPSGLDPTEKEQIVKTRVGQGLFKTKLLKFGCKCRICNISNPNFLIASHTKPWRVSSNKERLDPYNGFLLCPAHDALFDKGYISFEDNGAILISDNLNEQEKIFLNVNEHMIIDVIDEHAKYLTYHREMVFKQLDIIRNT
ncbi:HNH endonuclease [Paenibacillus sp. NPDC057934]|uniref:HNH endonuclease n=1 Tax=Paenibacillus sp. NPDC057934 TaxID=3346282 RepID=UPI0036DA8A4D